MSDPRFARLKSDPRFRRPKKKLTKVVIDERFKTVFDQEKKKNRPKVDKYGRPVSETQERDDLKRFYRLKDNSDEEEESKKPDLARGEVLLESSDEEDEENEEKNDSSNGNPRGGPSQPKSSLHSEDSEIDLDENNFAELEQQAATYAKDHQEEETQEGPRTARLAVVNLDWDHVRAHHLYKICASLVSPTAPLVHASTSSLERQPSRRQKYKGVDGAGPVNVVRGKVLHVRVYPSDFGKERMAKEEKEGPPPEIFKKKDIDNDEVDEKNIYDIGGEDDYDEDALRKYQLERLRYYYAIVTCDTSDAASHIYNELEGSELERSANVFDLSFVPDGMSFDGEPRDEATGDLNTTFKAVDFVTDALRHSKVKLTWDGDDPQRNQVTRRALTRKEIEENDFNAYIANTSSESEPDTEDKLLSSKKDKKASRERLRALLLGGNNEAIPEGWGDDGAVDDVDMEITFTPGLSDKKDKEDETTLERYQRKMKEKRKKKKEEVTGKRAEEGEKLEDDFFEQASDEAIDEDVEGDRFAKSRPRKNKGSVDHKDSSLRPEVTAEELALLVASDNPNAEPKHFNIKSVIKAEKQKKRKKGRKAKGDVELNETQEDFILDVKDERFKALHEDHQFAIDPSNPHFNKTKSMAALLEERQKRQREINGNEMDRNSAKSRNVGVSDSSRNLQSLVESVKRKSVQSEIPGQGKRRKL